MGLKKIHLGVQASLMDFDVIEYKIFIDMILYCSQPSRS